MDQYDRMTQEVIEGLKEEFPAYFHEDDWDASSSEERDDILTICCLRGILTGLDHMANVLQEERTGVKGIADGLGTEAVLRAIQRLSSDNDSKDGSSKKRR